MSKQKQIGAFLVILLCAICPQTFGQSPMRVLEIQVLDRHSDELLKCSCLVQKSIRRTVIADSDSENPGSSGSDVSGKLTEVNPDLFDVELNIMIEKNLKPQAPVTTSQRITKLSITSKLSKDKLISIDCGGDLVCKLKIVDLRISVPKY
ncbi:MAG: hypothetical protein KGQ60_07275 [Planctomycetes bacterium]|nr:hypothetical protein [Planctomycetota bacterium]